ncbi:ORF3 [Torque teno mini virus 12]|uniref:ORF3 n=1 Tax=Torque teno mini virus 12 TaxID=2065038 RepID=A8DMR3_9VIRU|nr:ORF3 [Torque teno mini virus 12]ABU55897.1 ORF3 [Torque teno mini virus 12]
MFVIHRPNQTFLNPVTSYRQLYCRIQNIPSNTTCKPLTSEGDSLQKRLQNESKKTMKLNKLFCHLQDKLQWTSSSKPPRQHRQRTHRRRKKSRKHCSSSSSDTSESNGNSDTESSSC